jgi:hypothetical protein
MQTVPELATQYLAYFELKERTNGDKFYCLTDNRPDKLYELVQQAHGDFIPDDYKYEFIHDALTMLSEVDNEATEDDMQELGYHIEADYYTSELLKWVSSHGARIAYCDDAIEQGIDSFTNVLMTAQQVERQEVYAEVLTILDWHIREKNN